MQYKVLLMSLWLSVVFAHDFTVDDFVLLLHHTKEEIINSPELLARCKELSSELRDEDGNTGFMWACEHHESLALNMLEMHDVLALPINHQNNFGDTAFMLACCRNQQQLVAKMFEMHHPLRLEINAEDSGGDTAFMQACIQNNRRIVDLFLEYYDRVPFDVNKKNKAGVSAFIMSCFHDDGYIAFKMLDHGYKLGLNLVLEQYENKPLVLWLFHNNKINILEKMIDCFESYCMSIDTVGRKDNPLFLLTCIESLFILAASTKSSPLPARAMLRKHHILKCAVDYVNNVLSSRSHSCFKKAARRGAWLSQAENTIILHYNYSIMTIVRVYGYSLELFIKTWMADKAFAVGIWKECKKIGLTKTESNFVFVATPFMRACFTDELVALEMLKMHKKKELRLDVNALTTNLYTIFMEICFRCPKVALKILEMHKQKQLEINIDRINDSMGHVAFLLNCLKYPEVALKVLEMYEELELTRKNLRDAGTIIGYAFLFSRYPDIALKILNLHKKLRFKIEQFNETELLALLCNMCKSGSSLYTPLILKILEMHKPSLRKNKNNTEVFITACRYNTELAIHMLDMHERLGFDVNFVDDSRDVAFRYACEWNAVIALKMLEMHKELKLNVNVADEYIQTAFFHARIENPIVALTMLIMRDKIQLDPKTYEDGLLIASLDEINIEQLYQIMIKDGDTISSIVILLDDLEHCIQRSSKENNLMYDLWRKKFLEYCVMRKSSQIYKIHQVKECADSYGSFIGKKTVNKYRCSVDAIAQKLFERKKLTFEDHIIVRDDVAVKATLQDPHMCTTMQLHENKEFQKLYYKVLLMCYMPDYVRTYCQQLKKTGSIGKAPLLSRLFDADTYCDPIAIPKDALYAIKCKLT